MNIVIIFSRIDFTRMIKQNKKKIVVMKRLSFMFCSNKDHVEEMKRINDEKLAELNAKVEDCESTLKSHRRELNVSNNFRTNFIDQKNNPIVYLKLLLDL